MIGKSKSQLYRYDNKGNLALYFPSGKSTSNIVLPRLTDLGVTYKLLTQGDYEEIYLVNEKYIEQLHMVLKFQIKGAKEQLKEEKKRIKELKKQKSANKK